MRPAGLVNDDGHHFATEVEGNLVYLDIVRSRQLLMQFLILQNRAVENVFEPGLEMAIEKCQFQYAVVVFQFDVAMLLQNNAIHRQRSGFVCAKHIHRTEVLDRVEPLDNHFLARHQKRALGQAYTHNHWKHLGRESYGYGQREQECLAPVVLGKSIDQEDRRHHHAHEVKHQPGEIRQALIESRRWRTLRDCARHAAEVGLAAGLDDRSTRGTAFDTRAEKTDVPQFQRWPAGNLVRRIKLLYRKRLPRQARLRQEQVPATEQTNVRGYHVTRREPDHVTRYQFGQRNFALFTVPDHRRSHVNHSLQLGGCCIGACFLEESKRYAEHHHDQHQHSASVVGSALRRRERNCCQR